MTFQHDCQALQNSPMFRDVEVAKLKLLAMASNRVSLEPGEALLRQGQPPEAVYVVLEGEADVYLETPKGDVHLARVASGEVVGEIGVLSGRPYSATIKAVGELTALRIERNSFLEILQEVPHLTLAISRELGRRLERMNERFAALAAQ
ncbi:MAG TPA: cyclic nucleotide-binding domain-containing protein [Hyphomicrobiaceae bacterium]|nr:cyclic nucleotide-binding domain-containing protein [Hyphomicrobiaceae bacterium]